MYKNDKVIRRYSEAFKLKILDELTTGKLNKYQLGKAYGIAPTTVNEWIKKYNRKDLMNTRITVKTKDEIIRIKELQKEMEQQVIEIVKQRRKSLPREGVRKLKVSLHHEFTKAKLKVGRDTLFKVLRKHNMLTLRKKPSYRTTNSYHRFYKYNNIIKELIVDRPNQIWVSDITYIRTVKGFCYLALITDAYSRKIVGWDLSNSLELSGCVRALNKALYQAKSVENIISSSR